MAASYIWRRTVLVRLVEVALAGGDAPPQRVPHSLLLHQNGSWWALGLAAALALAVIMRLIKSSPCTRRRTRMAPGLSSVGPVPPVPELAGKQALKSSIHADMDSPRAGQASVPVGPKRANRHRKRSAYENLSRSEGHCDVAHPQAHTTSLRLRAAVACSSTAAIVIGLGMVLTASPSLFAPAHAPTEAGSSQAHSSTAVPQHTMQLSPNPPSIPRPPSPLPSMPPSAPSPSPPPATMPTPPPIAPHPLSPCEDWCIPSPEAWKGKCTWRDCSGCFLCLSDDDIPKLPIIAPVVPADPEASPDARKLLALLSRVSASESFIFGHHNTDLEGQEFNDLYHKDGPGPGAPIRSDVATALDGTLPGMTGLNLDWVAREVKLSTPGWRGRIRPLLDQGVILNLFWESHNPVTGNDAHDVNGSPMTQIMPGGSVNHIWTQWMDRIIEWLDAVGVTQAIFRPFHENTGGWFWWGKTACTVAEFRAAWKYTTGYFRSRGVHSLIYAYSPSKPSVSYNWERAYGEDAATSGYPGDSEVDVTCLDRYGPGDFSADLIADCTRVVAFATSHGKVPAICEFGVRNGIQFETNPWWYSNSFLQPVLQHCPRIAFAYTWRNSAHSYWVPLPGQATYTGFRAFFQSIYTIFAGDPRIRLAKP